MMTKLQIFPKKEFKKIREFEKRERGEYLGFVYAIEWNGKIKIGSSISPFERLKTLVRNADKYGNVKTGKILVSRSHTNFRENEKLLHQIFSKSRINNSELFNCELKDVALKIEVLTFLDETKELEKQAKKVSEGFKELLGLKKQSETMSILDNHEFGKIRTLNMNNQIWFVGKDICRAFGDKNHNRTLSRIDEEDKIESTIIDNLGRNQKIKFINESGLYTLLFNLRPERANSGGVQDAYPIEVEKKIEKIKRFKRWVTNEVLPSIRKNGGYILGQENVSNKTLQEALDTAKNVIREKDILIESMEPKDLFADSVATSNTTILIGELAKILKGNGIEIGQNRLFEWLRLNGYLIKRHETDYNMPTQKSMELGLFKIKETVFTYPDGHTTISKTTKVTGKGQQYFINLFLKGRK